MQNIAICEVCPVYWDRACKSKSDFYGGFVFTMSKWSSRSITKSFFLIIVLSSARGQEKNSEFKHELPEGVELVDPKSLGLSDDDLSKFLGNVKVLGGG